MNKKLNDIPVVFILCRGRSGSTLLQVLLDAHPNICAPIEQRFVLYLYNKYHDIKVWDDKMINAFIDDLFTNRKFRLFWDIKKEKLRDNYTHYAVNSFSDACKVVYLSYPTMYNKAEIHLIIDKNPIHTRFIDMMDSVFEGSKFIHLVRDPRAVALSYKKYLPKANLCALAYQWNLFNYNIERKKRNASNFMQLKYEDLIQHKTQKIREVFDFSGIHLSDEQVEKIDEDRQKGMPNKYLSYEHHSNTIKPIESTNVDRWKEELTPKQIGIINNICADLMAKYGYRGEQVIKLSGLDKLKIMYGKTLCTIQHTIIKILVKLPFGLKAKLSQLIYLLFDNKHKN